MQSHMDTLLSSISQLLQALMGSSLGAGIAESMTASFPALAQATLLKVRGLQRLVTLSLPVGFEAGDACSRYWTQALVNREVRCMKTKRQ
jgi:hypothetical protein